MRFNHKLKLAYVEAISIKLSHLASPKLFKFNFMRET